MATKKLDCIGRSKPLNSIWRLFHLMAQHHRVGTILKGRSTQAKSATSRNPSTEGVCVAVAVFGIGAEYEDLTRLGGEVQLGAVHDFFKHNVADELDRQIEIGDHREQALPIPLRAVAKENLVRLAAREVKVLSKRRELQHVSLEP